MDYREIYQDELSTLKTYLQAHVKPEDAKLSWVYFNKRLRLNQLYQELMEENPLDTIEAMTGDVNAKVALILPNLTDDLSLKIIEAIRLHLKEYESSFKYHHIAILSYGKGVCFMNHQEALMTELTVIKPQIILSPMNLNIKGVTFYPIQEEEKLNEQLHDILMDVERQLGVRV